MRENKHDAKLSKKIPTSDIQSVTMKFENG